MASPAEPFIFGEIGYEHETGNAECDAGWCGGFAYPKPCEEEGCTGLIHANFGDESWDGYWLETKCDVCGEREAS